MATVENEMIQPVGKSRGVHRCESRRGRGFTLVEMMVTLVIMMLLFGIIFIPLNQAFNFFHIGQSRASLQRAARQALDQMADEVRLAVRVYPNDITPGVTGTGTPYNNFPPYIDVDNPVASNSCSTSSLRVANTSRLDFIPAETDNSGELVTPVRPSKVLVTYYARRLTRRTQSDPTIIEPYNEITNPLVLFRAQSPIRNDAGGAFEVPGSSALNVDTRANRYSAGCTNRGSAWLMQHGDTSRDADNVRRATHEPDFESPLSETVSATNQPEPITSDRNLTTVAASHTRAIPLNTSLTRGRTGNDLTPRTTFVCEDSNRDGKIDRVTITLALQEFDVSSTGTTTGAQPKPQSIRLSTTVDLPNVM